MAGRIRRGMSILAVLWVAIQRFGQHEAHSHAGHISFTSLLAIFPFLIFLTAVASFLGQPDSVHEFMELATEYIPAEVASTLAPVVGEVVTGRRGGLLTLGMIGTLWAASTGVEALRLALNRAYGVTKPRPLWFRRLQGLFFVVTGALAILVAIASVVAGPIIWQIATEWFFVPEGWRWLYDAGRYLVGIGAVFLSMGALYRWLPNAEQSWRNVIPGAAFATAVWAAVASLFSVYLAQFGNYSVTYGSLGGIVITMLFFFISASIFILGAELNATIRDRRLAEKTQAPASPAPQK